MYIFSIYLYFYVVGILDRRKYTNGKFVFLFFLYTVYIHYTVYIEIIL